MFLIIIIGYTHFRIQIAFLKVGTFHKDILNNKMNSWLLGSLIYLILFTGWRIRKEYFMIKDKENPKKKKYVLSWVCVKCGLVFFFNLSH